MKSQAEQIVKCAKTFLGNPYKYGAYLDERCDEQLAFDCSSFVQYVFRKCGKELPRSTVLQAASPGLEIQRMVWSCPSDLLFFEGEVGHYRHDLFPGRKLYIGHVAIYVGNNEMVHAVNSCGVSGVKRQLVYPGGHPLYNAQTIVLIKRFV